MLFTYIIRIDFLAHHPISSLLATTFADFKSNTVTLFTRCDKSNLRIKIVTDGGKRFAPKIEKAIRRGGVDKDQAGNDREIFALRYAAVMCPPPPVAKQSTRIIKATTIGRQCLPLPYLSAAILGRDNRTTSLL